MRTATELVLSAITFVKVRLGPWIVKLSFLSGGLLALAGGIVYATIPDHAGVIHGCYRPQTGNLRVIDDSLSQCKAGEQSLSWAVTGPQGEQGPEGPGVAAFAADSGFDPVPITQNTAVVSLALPAGHYVFTGKLVAGDSGASNVVVCSLHNSGGGGGPSTLDISQTPVLAAASFATLPLVGNLSLTSAATIEIVCTAQSQTGSALAQFARLNAVQVSTLQVQ